MKKVLYLTAIILVLFTSCSSDNIEPELQEPVFIKEIEISHNNSILRMKFLYDGNKIKSIFLPDGTRENYTYTNDFITKIDNVNASGKLYSTREYAYKNGKIFSVLNSEYDSFMQYYVSLIKYDHNNDGMVTGQSFKVNLVTGLEEEKNVGDWKMYFKNGNMVKFEEPNSTISYEYEYDNKNSIYKNILNYGLLLDMTPSVNNRIKSFTIENSKKTLDNINAYEYNSNGYPSKSTTDAGNKVPFAVLNYIY